MQVTANEQNFLDMNFQKSQQSKTLVTSLSCHYFASEKKGTKFPANRSCESEQKKNLRVKLKGDRMPDSSLAAHPSTLNRPTSFTIFSCSQHLEINLIQKQQLSR